MILTRWSFDDSQYAIWRTCCWQPTAGCGSGSCFGSFIVHVSIGSGRTSCGGPIKPCTSRGSGTFFFLVALVLNFGNFFCFYGRNDQPRISLSGTRCHTRCWRHGSCLQSSIRARLRNFFWAKVFFCSRCCCPVNDDVVCVCVAHCVCGVLCWDWCHERTWRRIHGHHKLSFLWICCWWHTD